MHGSGNTRRTRSTFCARTGQPSLRMTTPSRHNKGVGDCRWIRRLCLPALGPFLSAFFPLPLPVQTRVLLMGLFVCRDQKRPKKKDPYVKREEIATSCNESLTPANQQLAVDLPTFRPNRFATRSNDQRAASTLIQLDVRSRPLVCCRDGSGAASPHRIITRAISVGSEPPTFETFSVRSGHLAR